MPTSSAGPLPWFLSFHLVQAEIGKAIYSYNHLRQNASDDYLTPAQGHSMEGILKKRWYRNNTKKAVITNTNNLFSTL
jgi:hypothetical protein